jgi:hypothetical protein
VGELQVRFPFSPLHTKLNFRSAEEIGGRFILGSGCHLNCEEYSGTLPPYVGPTLRQGKKDLSRHIILICKCCITD